MRLVHGPDLQWLMFTIYDHPADFPGDVVVRATSIRGRADPDRPVALPQAWTFADVAAARRAIRATKAESVCFARDDGDSPSIVESWF